MQNVNLAEAKTHLSALVENAAAGEPVLILRRGKPIAQITAIAAPRKPIDLAALRALTGRMRAKGKGAGIFTRTMRDNARSVLVAALTREVELERVQGWLAEQSQETLAISDWVTIEFSSALSIKLRRGDLTTDHRADALATFARLSTDTFVKLAVTGQEFCAAAHFADQACNRTARR